MGREKLILWSRSRNRNRSRSRGRGRGRDRSRSMTASQRSRWQWWKSSQLLLKISRKMKMLCLNILFRMTVKDLKKKKNLQD